MYKVLYARLQQICGLFDDDILLTKNIFQCRRLITVQMKHF